MQGAAIDIISDIVLQEKVHVSQGGNKGDNYDNNQLNVLHNSPYVSALLGWGVSYILMSRQNEGIVIRRVLCVYKRIIPPPDGIWTKWLEPFSLVKQS